MEDRRDRQNRIDRRSFLRIAGTSIGIGVLYEFAPFLDRRAEAGEMNGYLQAGEWRGAREFHFRAVQRSTRRFPGPARPAGHQGLRERGGVDQSQSAAAGLNAVTDDLTHDAEPRRSRPADAIVQVDCGRINTPAIHAVPGENDAALDGGVLYREHFGDSHYSFDHKGVHFIALDNVSQGSPEVGAEQLAWLKADLARSPKTAPIILFTHRPLFDLKPEWEWFTRDGDEVMNLVRLMRTSQFYMGIFIATTCGRPTQSHYATRSLIFAFNDPATNSDKKPSPFDKDEPFKELGIRLVTSKGSEDKPTDLASTTSYSPRPSFRALGNAADDQGQQFNRWEFIQ